MLREKKKASAVKIFGEISRRHTTDFYSRFFSLSIPDFRIYCTKIREKGKNYE